jgi:hypothetical protein
MLRIVRNRSLFALPITGMLRPSAYGFAGNAGAEQISRAAMAAAPRGQIAVFYRGQLS